MIRIFKSLFFSADRDVEMVYAFLRILKVPASKSAVKAELSEHPDSPSLLSVSDTLSNFGVENAAAKITAEQLDQLKAPFIARMRSGEGLSLVVVKEINNSSIIYLLAGEYRWVTRNKELFLQDFQGIVIVGEVSETVHRQNFSDVAKKERRQRRNTVLGISVLPVLVLTASILTLFQYGIPAVVPALYGVLALAGATIGSLLLWHEVDHHSPVLKQVCSGGKRINCESVLSSKASTIFGISWGLIGFSYFTGTLLLILAYGIMRTELFELFSILSVSALAYTFFSLFYQWRIAKQWCVLCLWTQGILVAQAVLVLIDGRLWTSGILISTDVMLAAFTCFAFPFLTGLLVVPALKKAKDGENSRKELVKLKHNEHVFRALLEKQRAIVEPTDGLGIRLGRTNAKHRIIKVCNPYCGPCARAHPAIDEILAENPNVEVQIIFTASDDDKDIKAAPTRHLMAVSSTEDEQTLKRALDDWYLAKKKDYSAFAAKYPLNGELQMQGDKIKAMRAWCDKMEIRFTPTFFVDGYQLPRLYSVEDLKHFRWSITEDE